MPLAFAVRPAAASDIGAVAGLFQEYAASLDVDLAYQDFAAELAALPGAYAPPAGALLVAAPKAGPLLGCVAVRPLSQPGECEMKRLYVRPAGRNTGAGLALATAAIEAATQAGYHAMRLDTLASMVQAQALYRRLGFAATPAYYNSPVPGTVFMRKPLRTTETPP
jgi:ribosomal protein S18 acetylase RimI-like enzyme